MLFFYSLTTFLNAVAWLTFAPLTTILRKVYNINDFVINYYAFSYVAFCLILNIPSVYILDKYGLKVGVIIGMLLNVSGLLLRTLINYNLLFSILGQTLLAMAAPFVINSPSKFSKNWFPKN